MSEDTVTITVDGESIEAPKGAMLIEVTDKSGKYVPRFCYHDRLSVAANCRMCLVEVEKAPKPLPACATPVMDGMVVHTKSELAVNAQKSTMEFLLINHPLDCPICDQGGECELQDLAMGYGSDVSRYTERKRVVKDKNIGPLVQTDMTRCIHCTRCVRFGEEVAGLRELGATGRGENMQIGTYIEKAMRSEMSGNVIDLCPVGALTSKPYRYSARAWELREAATIAGHDAVGSNIAVHVKGRVAKRVVPRANDDVNEVWISDRDRYAYEALNHPERATRPLQRGPEGTWQELDWDQAFASAADRLNGVVDAHGPGAVAALVSPSATVEEGYLAQKLMRGLGSSNIDHRLRWADFSDDLDSVGIAWLGMPIAELENVNAALIVGTNLRQEQPLLNHRLRKASLAGADIAVINPHSYGWNFTPAEEIADGGSAMLGALAALADAVGVDCEAGIPRHDEQAAQRIAQMLRGADKAVCLVGSLAHAHPAAATIRKLVAGISAATGANFAVVPEGANAAGLALAGALPHLAPGLQKLTQPGMNTAQIIDSEVKAIITLGVEAPADFLNATGASALMERAEFVISLSGYADEAAKAGADLILPIALYPENEGSFVNGQMLRQAFKPAIKTQGDARPAWKVLRVLGQQLGLDGFDYLDVEAVAAQVQIPGDSVPVIAGAASASLSRDQ